MATHLEHLCPMPAGCARPGAEVRPYCLVWHKGHLILVPQATNGLLRAIGETHRRFVRRISHRGGLWGHLWEEFRPSFLLDESQLVAAARYLESHHGSGWLCSHPDGRPPSGVGSYLSGEDGLMVGVAPIVALFANWRSCLHESSRRIPGGIAATHARTGRRAGRGSACQGTGSSTGTKAAGVEASSGVETIQR
jgi:hypothetical protein